jgi:hypothetical protein
MFIIKNFVYVHFPDNAILQGFDWKVYSYVTLTFITVFTTAIQ